MTGDVKVDLDEVLMVTGCKGKYQIIQSILLLLTPLSVAFPILSIVFIGYVPEHRCAQLPNGTNLSDFGVSEDEVVDIVYNQCSIDIKSNNSGVTALTNIKCINGYDYFNAHKDISIVSEWDLVCGRAGLSELSQTLFMLGQGFGAFICTSLADKYGRKPIHLITQGGLLSACIAIVFINNIGGFIFLRFIVGAMQQSVGLTGYAIFVEMLVTDLRPLAGCLNGLSWTISIVALAPLGYLLQHYSWRYFQVIIIVAMSYAVLLIWFMDESLRWLMANNKIEKAENIIRKMCKANKTEFTKSRLILREQMARSKTTNEQETMLEKMVPVNEIQRLKPGLENTETIGLPPSDNKNGEEARPLIDSNTPDTPHSSCNKAELMELNVQENSLESDVIKIEKKNKKSEKSPDQYTVFDIFKYFDILKVTVILCYIWAINSVTYYGLFLTSSSLSGNRFFNYFLNAVVELPSLIFVFAALKRLDRRSVCGLSMIISGVALIISVTLVATVGDTSVGSTSSVVFSLIGKFAITASFHGLFIYTPELFPTNMRNAGLGVGSSAARIGGMVAPFSSLLSDVVIWGPGVVFGCGCLIAAMLITVLPETRGRPLPTTIEEMRAWKNIKTSTLELSIK